MGGPGALQQAQPGLHTQGVRFHYMLCIIAFSEIYFFTDTNLHENVYPVPVPYLLQCYYAGMTTCFININTWVLNYSELFLIHLPF